MIVGLTSDNYKQISILSILRILKWIGVDFSEVTVNAFNNPVKLSNVVRGMMVGLHLPNLGNFGYDFSSLQSAQIIENVLGKISVHRNRFDFQYAVFHPPEACNTADGFQYYIHNLKRVHLPLIIENIPCYSLERFQKLYWNIKNELGDRIVGICLDIPHATIAGDEWHDYYRCFRIDIKAIHLSDCTNKMDLHLPFPYGGKLTLKDILLFLQQENYSGIVNFEIIPPSIGQMNTVLETYLSAKEIIDYYGYKKIKNRAHLVSCISRLIGSILHHFSNYNMI
jgi:hypothetical protein